MWIASTLGFYSVVRKGNGIHVRARKEQDIYSLRQYLGIETKPIFTPRADYRWRLIMSFKEWRKQFPKLSELITYDNFKNEVRKTNREREFIYHEMWAVGLKIEREDMK